MRLHRMFYPLRKRAKKQRSSPPAFCGQIGRWGVGIGEPRTGGMMRLFAFTRRCPQPQRTLCAGEGQQVKVAHPYLGNAGVSRAGAIVFLLFLSPRITPACQPLLLPVMARQRQQAQTGVIHFFVADCPVGCLTQTEKPDTILVINLDKENDCNKDGEFVWDKRYFTHRRAPALRF